jgi:hypothetical protein
MSATNQRNIFIDTEQYHGSDNKAKLLFPSQTLVVPQGFGIKLSLQQFTMKKTFYNINEYNRIFYIYDESTTTYQEVKLSTGDFFAFASNGGGASANTLCKNIEDALLATSGISSATVTYDFTTRKININSTSLTSTKYIVFFQIPQSRQGTIPAGVSQNGYFSDTAEIFGGIANQEVPSVHPTPGLSQNGNDFTSYYPASLFSMESLRILINLGNTNLETPNMDANSSTSICLTSQTFGTIPVHTGTFNGNDMVQPSMIYFQDDGDELFSIKLQQNHIDNATFSLVDNKGRPLDETGANQFKNGQLSYQMVIRFEIIEEPFVANPSNLPSLNKTGNLLPALR